MAVGVFAGRGPTPSVEARAPERGGESSWPSAAGPGAGEPLSAITGYRIYRADVKPPVSSSPQVLPQGKAESHGALVGSSETNAYRDTNFVFDQTYIYIVRSVIQVEGHELESSDSQPLKVTPRDTFAPATPQDLVAAVLPGAAPRAVLVELSWSINLETDLAGYRVYKSEQEGARGELLTPDLLPTPAVRDTSVKPGHSYWYTVTSVERAETESARSATLVVEVTQPSN